MDPLNNFIFILSKLLFYKNEIAHYFVFYKNTCVCIIKVDDPHRFCQFFSGKVHGSLARAGKVKGQTPKVFYPNIFNYQIDLLGVYASWFADILKLMIRWDFWYT
jgi:hypothetical protein